MSGRYSRKNFDPDGYARELGALRAALAGADASAPTAAVELAELERLVARYPEHARRLVAALPPSTAAPP